MQLDIAYWLFRQFLSNQLIQKMVKTLDYLIPAGYKNKKGLNNTYPIPFN